MPALADFVLSYEDGALNISMTPSIPIGGLNFQFVMMKRFGSPTPILIKSMISGYYGVSGMDIINSGLGVMRVLLSAMEVSGLPFGNYAYQVQRLDSGSITTISEGYRLLN